MKLCYNCVGAAQEEMRAKQQLFDSKVPEAGVHKVGGASIPYISLTDAFVFKVLIALCEV